jgi:U3 small nucleolar RNA-associated protein 10
MQKRREGEWVGGKEERFFYFFFFSSFFFFTSTLYAMTSSLAIQLNRIAGFERYKSDKFTASFLFDAKQAADYDLLSIYDLGVAGLRELEELNESRFSEFHHTLFSEQMKGFDRTIKTKEENNMLDESIMEFLQCLSQYFLTKSAGKCLEWLIRRFRQVY